MTDVVWLLRHGNRADFVDSTWRERAELPDDPPLSSDGVEQAKRAAHRLSSEGITRIYASPFLRTIQTAHLVAEVLELPVLVEPGLGEHLSPAWFRGPPTLHGIPTLLREYPRVSNEHEPLASAQFPESTEDAYRRAAATVRALAERSPGPMLCVGHGASVTGAAVHLAGGSDRENLCPLAGLFLLVREGGRWMARLRGETSHLDSSQGADRYF